MKKPEKAAFVKTTLDSLFPNPGPSLEYLNRFTFLIAVLLSAQCTDERVNKVTKELFAMASTPQEMVKIPTEEIERIIKPCGFYRNKAKAISSLSRILIEKFNGEVPSSLEDLETLPGVGHKTASVISAQAFSIPAFPVDTHIHRCAKRWGLSRGKNVVETEKDLKKLFAKQDWIKIHLQIIYYARKHCPARAHKNALCPICHRLTEIHS